MQPFGPNDNFNEDTGHVIPSLISKFEKSIRGGPLKSYCGGMAQQLISCHLLKWRTLNFIEKGPQGIINVCSGVKNQLKM